MVSLENLYNFNIILTYHIICNQEGGNKLVTVE